MAKADREAVGDVNVYFSNGRGNWEKIKKETEDWATL